MTDPARLATASPERPARPLPRSGLRLVAAPQSEPPYDDQLSSPPVLRLVAPLSAGPPPLRAVLPAPRTSTGDLPDARPFALALVQRMLEVCGGVRPVLQLQRDTTPQLYADLERNLTRRARATGARPSSRDVRSVHVQQRPDGVAEVCATVRRGDRVGALALRLEAVHGRWLCTQLQGL